MFQRPFVPYYPCTDLPTPIPSTQTATTLRRFKAGNLKQVKTITQPVRTGLLLGGAQLGVVWARRPVTRAPAFARYNRQGWHQRMRFDDFVSKLPIYRHIKNEMVKRSEIRTAAQTLVKLQIDQYVQKHLFAEPRYHDPKRLNRFEYSVFSQFGEDGIIAEIFRRIGETSRFFVEFGVGDGVENNTTYLLTKGWAGAWVEGNSHQVEKIHTRFASVLRDRKLALKQACVTAENAESLLSELSVPQEFDLLSIDIDYNTYWVWRAISSYRPKAIVVEYNAAFPPGDPWIVAYHPDGAWDGSSHMGASLTSLCALGESGNH